MRRAIPVFLACVLVALPFLASAQLLGPLVQCEGVPNDRNLPVCQACNAVRLGQNIINFFVAAASFIGIGMLIYAGFLLLTSGGNTGGRDNAKRIIWNVLIGLVIVLIAWLAIDTVMKYLFQGNVGEPGSPLYEQFKEGSGFGPWNQIECVGELVQNAPGPGAGGSATAGQRSGAGVGTCAELKGGLCSASALGERFGAAASNASQVCNVESAGDPSSESKIDILRKSGNRPFSVGLFQVNLTANALSCGGKQLNCPSAFRGRNYDAEIVNEPLYAECVVAAKNTACNLGKAQQLHTRSGWQAWQNTAIKCNILI